jgi:hypothetical protein
MPFTPLPEPLHLRLLLDRVSDSTQARQFQMVSQPYRRRLASGSFALQEPSLPWTEGLMADLLATTAVQPDRGAARRLGRTLRNFLLALDWAADEAAIVAAVASGRRVRLTFEASALELYALPWELLPLGEEGRPLSELGLISFTYRQLGLPTPTPTGAPPRDRILFGWASGGAAHGAVPAGAHLALLNRLFARKARFVEQHDQLADLSYAQLAKTLREAAKDRPYTVLHLLCHGAPTGQGGFGLVWSAGASGARQVIDSEQLAQVLAPYRGTLRTVWLFACHSAQVDGVVSHLGSLAQALHDAGIETVLASRFPLSADGSVTVAEALYTGLRERLLCAEDAVGAARTALLDHPTLDHAALQLYGNPPAGADLRPLVLRPYRGLLAYEQRHHAIFHGRAAEITELRRLCEALERSDEPRFVVVTGNSGSGKSSVVMAGLLPRYRDGKALLCPRVVPDADPIRRLADALAATLGAPIEPTVDAVVNAVRARPADCQPVVFVDQLEELFTMVQDPAVRVAFVGLLWQIARELTVLTTLRLDFAPRCSELRLPHGVTLDRLLFDPRHAVLISRLSRENLRAVIEHPAAIAGLRFEPGLVERILDDLGDEPGHLPLLAFALELFWEHRQGPVIRQATFDALGGVRGALERRADQVFDSLPADEKKSAIHLMLQLYGEPEDGRYATRRRYLVEHIAPSEPGPRERFDRVLDRFVKERLLVVGEGTSTVEVAHEALLRRWGRLATWVKENSQLRELLHEQEAFVQGRDEYHRPIWNPITMAKAWVLWWELGPNVSAEASRAFRRETGRVVLRTLLVVAVITLVIVNYVNTLKEAQARTSAQADRAAAASLLMVANEQAISDPTIAQAALWSIEHLDDVWYKRVADISTKSAARHRLVWSEPVVHTETLGPTTDDDARDLFVLTGMDERDATAWRVDADAALPCERSMLAPAGPTTPACQRLASHVLAWATSADRTTIALIYRTPVDEFNGAAPEPDRLCVVQRSPDGPGWWAGSARVDAFTGDAQRRRLGVSVSEGRVRVLHTSGAAVAEFEVTGLAATTADPTRLCASGDLGLNPIPHEERVDGEVTWVGYLRDRPAWVAVSPAADDDVGKSTLWINAEPSHSVADYVHTALPSRDGEHLLLLGHFPYLMQPSTTTDPVAPLVAHLADGRVDALPDPVLGAISDDGTRFAVATLRTAYTFHRAPDAATHAATSHELVATALSCTTDGCLFGTRTGDLRRVSEAGDDVYVGFHPDGEVTATVADDDALYSASTDGTVRVWHTTSQAYAARWKLGAGATLPDGWRGTLRPGGVAVLVSRPDGVSWAGRCEGSQEDCAAKLSDVELISVSEDARSALLLRDGGWAVNGPNHDLTCPTLPPPPAAPDQSYYVDTWRTGPEPRALGRGVVVTADREGTVTLHPCAPDDVDTATLIAVKLPPRAYAREGGPVDKVLLRGAANSLALREHAKAGSGWTWTRFDLSRQLHPGQDSNPNAGPLDATAAWLGAALDRVQEGWTCTLRNPGRPWICAGGRDTEGDGDHLRISEASGRDAVLQWPTCGAITAFGLPGNAPAAAPRGASVTCCDAWCGGEPDCTEACVQEVWGALTLPPMTQVARATVERVTTETSDDIVVALLSERGHLSVRRWAIGPTADVLRFEMLAPGGGAPLSLHLRADGRQVLSTDLSVEADNERVHHARLWPADGAGEPSTVDDPMSSSPLLAAGYGPGTPADLPPAETCNATPSDPACRFDPHLWLVTADRYATQLPTTSDAAREQSSRICLTHTEIRQFAGVDAEAGDVLWNRCSGTELTLDRHLLEGHLARPKGLRRAWPPPSLLTPLPRDCAAWFSARGDRAPSAEVAAQLRLLLGDDAPLPEVHEATLYLNGRLDHPWTAWCVRADQSTYLPLQPPDDATTLWARSLSATGSPADPPERPGNLSVHWRGTGAQGEPSVTLYAAARVQAIDGDVLQLRTDDARFALHLGPAGLISPLGTAVAGSEGRPGLVSLELAGTPFRLADQPVLSGGGAEPMLWASCWNGLRRDPSPSCDGVPDPATGPWCDRGPCPPGELVDEGGLCSPPRCTLAAGRTSLLASVAATADATGTPPWLAPVSDPSWSPTDPTRASHRLDVLYSPPAPATVQ